MWVSFLKVTDWWCYALGKTVRFDFFKFFPRFRDSITSKHGRTMDQIEINRFDAKLHRKNPEARVMNVEVTVSTNIVNRVFDWFFYAFLAWEFGCEPYGRSGRANFSKSLTRLELIGVVLGRICYAVRRRGWTRLLSKIIPMWLKPASTACVSCLKVSDCGIFHVPNPILGITSPNSARKRNQLSSVRYVVIFWKCYIPEFSLTSVQGILFAKGFDCMDLAKGDREKKPNQLFAITREESST